MIVNPGIRRFLGSAIQRLFNSASFYAPLTHSLALERGAGSPTFTRATPATVTDHEGVLRTAIAGEARFEGARRVRNLLQGVVGSSEDITSSGWLVTNAPTRTATTFATTITTQQLYVPIGSAAPTVGDKFLVQVVLSGTPGNKINLYAMNGAASSGAGVQVTLTATPTVYSIVGTVSVSAQHYIFLTSGSFLTVPVGTANQTVTCTKFQAEDITGRADQTTPSEYVSVGVESAPYYHGSFVDGVKCFPTDLSGNPIPAATMLGYLAEGARENLCLQSQTFDNASWTNTNVTVTANAAVAPDGTTTADLLYPASSGVDGDRRTLQAVTSTTVAHTVSFYLKYAGFRWVMVSNTDAGANDDKNWFDVQNGVVGTIGAGTTSMSAVSVGNGWYRVSVTATNATTNCYAWVSCVDGNGSSTVTASGTNGVYAWGAQVELGSFASSYIATTTVAVTRNADVLTYSGGDIPNLKTLCATFKRESGVSSVGVIVALSDGTTNNYAEHAITSATANSFQGGAGGGTQWNTAASSYTAGTASKVAWSAATNDVKGAKDGVAVTQDTVATMPISPTQLNVGHVAGSFQLNGNVGGIYGWTRNLSQSELNAITA